MDAEVPEMYVRVKREKQTVFVSCSSSDTVESVVAKVATILQKDAATIRLALGETPLDPAAKLADAGVENDAILRMSFLVNGLLHLFFLPSHLPSTSKHFVFSQVNGSRFERDG